MNERFKGADESKRITGICKWFSRGEGRGFVTVDNKDYFVTSRILANCLIVFIEKGDTVSFIPHKGTQGMYCQYVKLIKRRERKNN